MENKKIERDVREKQKLQRNRDRETLEGYDHSIYEMSHEHLNTFMTPL